MRRFGLALLLIVAVLPSAGCRRIVPDQPAAAVAPPASAYELELGKGIYLAYCATCHGEAGAGDGFNAFNLDPRPRDLGDPALQKSKSDEDLEDVVRRGGSGVGLSSLMPPWGHTLNERQIEEVVLYLRSLERD